MKIWDFSPSVELNSWIFTQSTINKIFSNMYYIHIPKDFRDIILTNIFETLKYQWYFLKFEENQKKSTKEKSIYNLAIKFDIWIFFFSALLSM